MLANKRPLYHNQRDAPTHWSWRRACTTPEKPPGSQSKKQLKLKFKKKFFFKELQKYKNKQQQKLWHRQASQKASCEQLALKRKKVLTYKSGSSSQTSSGGPAPPREGAVMGKDGEAEVGSVWGKLLLVEIRKVNTLSPSHSLHQLPHPCCPLAACSLTLLRHPSSSHHPS